MCWGFAARTPLWPFPSITLWSVSELNPLSVRRVGQIIRSLNAPDVAAMGISDWSGCAPCLIFYISAETKVSNIVIVILYAEDNKLKLT
jgi:hypothetical protein